ncbi:MAG TPA: transcriptional repressor, partial [Methylomirabilota bacterium]|nr:transcriptional repressor [Methylomirabilota bacterium]
AVRAQGAPPAPEAARARVEDSGHRMTPQRAAVYDYLARVDTHPTAEEVYRAVKRRLPRVGLATVYNSLEVLVRSGLVGKLTAGHAAARYDARTDVHSHVRCLRCGRVEDLDVVPDAGWLGALPTRDFEATAFRFELLGRCAACRA